MQLATRATPRVSGSVEEAGLLRSVMTVAVQVSLVASHSEAMSQPVGGAPVWYRCTRSANAACSSGAARAIATRLPCTRAR